MRGEEDNASWQTRDYEVVTLGATVDSTWRIRRVRQDAESRKKRMRRGQQTPDNQDSVVADIPRLGFVFRLEI